MVAMDGEDGYRDVQIRVFVVNCWESTSLCVSNMPTEQICYRRKAWSFPFVGVRKEFDLNRFVAERIFAKQCDRLV